MTREEFLSQVRTLAELDSMEQAESATRSTLATLRERLAGNEPNNLADQLPQGLDEPLRAAGEGDSFPVGEFYARVAQKEGVGVSEATRHARAVATVVQETVTVGELDDVRDQLGDEYEELFGQPGASL